MELSPKYQRIYDDLIILKKENDKKKDSLVQEKKELEDKINFNNRYLQDRRNEIIKEAKDKHTELTFLKSIKIKELEKDLKVITEQFKRELEEDLKKASIFSKLIRIFTGYEKKKRKELDLIQKEFFIDAQEEFDKKIKENENLKNKKLDEFEQNNRNIKDLIKDYQLKIEDIKNELPEYIEELKKLSYKIKFVESGDKEKYDEIYSEVVKLLNLKIYPAVQKIEDIKNEVDNFKRKYKEIITFLEDKTINDLLKESNKEEFSNLYLKDMFVITEMERTEKLLSNIDGKSLDDQQRQAVVTNEDNNLVIAGAGSGKTLTISAKVKYLVDRLGVDPKQILLITFTKKAAEEMQERISKKLGINVNVKTFHALGYDLLGIFEGIKPDIFDDMEKFTRDFASKTIMENEQLRKNIFKYFSLYMNDYVDPQEFDSIGEYYRANKSNSFDTINFKINKFKEEDKNNSLNKELDEIREWLNSVYFEGNLESAFRKINDFSRKFEIKVKNETNESKKQLLQDLYKEFISLKGELGQFLETKETAKKEKLQKEINEKLERITKNKRTFKWEKVKSIEELIIANYLFTNGIEYVYEGEYKYNTASSKFRQYKPDFYLPKYDIYIEHFGIDENGKCPQYSKVEEAKYVDGIKWKRELHQANGTIMEETYSFNHKEGKLILKLNEILKKHKIPLKPLNKEKLTELLITLNEDNEYKELYKLLNTFLSLFKSCNYGKTDIDNFILEAKNEVNEYVSEKHILFLNIFKAYYEEYTKVLQKAKKIDFSDMINKATDYLENSSIPEGYDFKYIIIDEFQDISVARYKLIKKIKDKNNSIVMAVGDDWQSIYRFAGSEISIFTKFKQYFGETEQLKIEKTYRNSQQLINIAGDFVMKNPAQIKKELKSDKKLNKPVILVNYKENLSKNGNDQDSFERRLMLILNSFKKEKKSVMLLGRNNFDIKNLKESKFFSFEEKEGKIEIKSDIFPNLDIYFLSVHKSKGLEADEVIIINNKNTLTGFPNKMVSDSVLSYVMKDDEKYMYAEERRLFYVALTRTKNKTFLMVPEEYSNFVEELKNNKNVEEWQCDLNDEKINCPVCSTGYLIKRTGAAGKEFYSCSNYPQCNFSTGDIKAAKSKVRCPVCGGIMIKRKGKYGDFYGCSNYPHCNHTYDLEEFEKLEKKVTK